MRVNVKRTIVLVGIGALLPLIFQYTMGFYNSGGYYICYDDSTTEECAYHVGRLLGGTCSAYIVIAILVSFNQSAISFLSRYVFTSVYLGFWIGALSEQTIYPWIPDKLSVVLIANAVPFFVVIVLVKAGWMNLGANQLIQKGDQNFFFRESEWLNRKINSIGYKISLAITIAFHSYLNYDYYTSDYALKDLVFYFYPIWAVNIVLVVYVVVFYALLVWAKINRRNNIAFQN